MAHLQFILSSFAVKMYFHFKVMFKKHSYSYIKLILFFAIEEKKNLILKPKADSLVVEWAYNSSNQARTAFHQAKERFCAVKMV